MDLKGKTVFVTGSSRGIGAACAEAFAKKGANVIVNGRHGVSDELVKKIEANGVVCKTIIGDISVAEDVKRMTKEAYEAFETIDVLVNNAGITNDKLLIGMKDEDFDAVVNVNLRGTFLMTRAFLKKMYKKKSGAIIKSCISRRIARKYRSGKLCGSQSRRSRFDQNLRKRGGFAQHQMQCDCTGNDRKRHDQCIKR